MDLPNRVVVLTGASQGIGRAAAFEFVKAGCKVVLIARSAQHLNEIAADIGQRQALAVQADLRIVKDHATIVRQALDSFGRIDILINNAGIGIYAPCEEMAWSDLEDVMALNFFAAAHLTQICVPVMVDQGGGLVINVSSVAGRRAVPNMGVYSASKAALELLTEAWRVELADANIRFCTVYPGPVETGFKTNALGNIDQKSSPIKRISAQKVAGKLVEIARKEPRDAFATQVDGMRLSIARLFPSLVDRLLGRHYAAQSRDTE